jgi:coniferyl-aldehyde dehydrogenase
MDAAADATPAASPDTRPGDLAPVLQRLRDAWEARRPPLEQREADLRRLNAAFAAGTEAMDAAIRADFGHRSRHENLLSETMIVRAEIDHALANLRRWNRPRRVRSGWKLWPARAELRPQPLGVVGIIAPWNYPVNLALVPLVSAIAAGNHAYLKPSEHVPRTARWLRALLVEVFPDDRVAVALGGPEVGAAFAALPFDHLLFTGSTAVGRHVMAAAARNLTPVTLELGGKCPALVAPGSPVAHAADRIAFGKCFNGGQTCVAPDYVLVPRAQRDEFVRAYLASVKRRFPTLAMNPDYTAIINTRQAERLREWIDDARERKVTIMQHRPDQESAPPGVELVPPTVLLDPPDDALVMREEIFGPLLPVKGYDDHDDAIAYVLSRDRPLAFYPFDNDGARLERTLERVVAGTVCINDTVIQFGQDDLPIGGVGASGMGVYHGREGFLTFSKRTSVFRQSRLNGMKLFDSPYSNFARRLVEFLSK